MPKHPLFSDPQTLPFADIQWREGKPWACDFEDIYASSVGAIEEKRHVFLHSNQLEQRFSAVKAHHYFSVLELGFGTGLNFLLTWQLWKKIRHQQKGTTPARLIYTSIESRPLSAKAFGLCQAQWPELHELAMQLQAQYPINIKGFHRIEWDDVTLLLIQAPVEEALTQFHGPIDALYLDGFSPAKNADMWHPHTLTLLAQHCHASTTYATYSAARVVKDALRYAGFSYRVVQGFGKKRHQLVGGWVGLPKVSNNQCQAPLLAPWQQLPPPLCKQATIAVIGAGISGCATALALQQRGYQVQLIEQASHLAAGASGNQQGILYIKIPEIVTPAGQLHQQGLQYSMAHLNSLPQHNFFHASGLLQIANTQKMQQQHTKACQRGFPTHWFRFVDQEEASQISQWPIKTSGVYFSDSGWVEPTKWCQALAYQLHLPPWLLSKVCSVVAHNGRWQLRVERQETAQTHTYDGVVFANAYDAAHLLDYLLLPLGSIRGQVSYVESTDAPQTVVCSDGYMTPSQQGVMGVGASYDTGNKSVLLSQQDHQANVQKIHPFVPTITKKNVIGGRVSFRANTPDYLPMVGALADKSLMSTQFAPLRHDKNYAFSQTMPWLQGLYINAGHGSKGLVTAPLCAQLLAAQISGEPLPVSKTISDALSANRFFLRDMIRGKC